MGRGERCFSAFPLPTCKHARFSGLCFLGTGGSTAFRRFPHPKTRLRVCRFWGLPEHVHLLDLCSLGRGGRRFLAFPSSYLRACPPFGPLLFGTEGTPLFGIPSFLPTSMPAFRASAPLGWEGAPLFGVSPVLKRIYASAGSGGLSTLRACPPFGPLLSWDGRDHHLSVSPPS